MPCRGWHYDIDRFVSIASPGADGVEEGLHSVLIGKRGELPLPALPITPLSTARLSGFALLYVRLQQKQRA